MTSLTRDEAVRRARTVTVDAYDVALDLTGDDRHFASVTTIRLSVLTGGGADTFVDVAARSLRAVRLDGRPLDVAVDDRRLVLVDLAEGPHELVVEADLAYSHDGEGLHRQLDPADGRSYLYAMSFLDAAPRWFACFDQPDLKAPVSIEVRCPADWTVAGNGPATPIGPGHWRIAPTGPLAPYFTTLIAGPYHEVRDTHEGIPLVLHARQSLAEHLDRDAAELFALTKRCLDECHRLFGVRYPWGEYHQAFVPGFNPGAMENPGCVTLTDSLVFRSRATEAEYADRAVTIAHEMAHMWFGDLVTMRWWDDLWLNESFAEYTGQRLVGAQSWPAFGIERKGWGYRADRRPSTHPVAGNGAVDAAAALTEFDGISYAKGASVLRQLALQLGDEVFLAGLRDYVARHAHGNAEFADLLAAWTRAGATGLEDWTNAWLRTTGVDGLAVDGGDVVRTRALGVDRPHGVAVARFGVDGAERERRTLTIDADRVPHGLVATPGELVLPDADDQTWAKLELDAAGWGRMPARLGALPEATRVAVWNALQLTVADAELDPAGALEIVLAALPGENDAVVAVIGRWAVRTLVSACLGSDARDTALDRLAAALLAATRDAEPGSGRQLASARVVVAASRDGDLLERWRAGHDLPPGLVVDAEFRWLLLRRLAALGQLSATDVETEAQADRSSRGAEHAAACRAARPDHEAKAEAWRVLVADAERPNLELYATADGFWQPGQDEWTAPYAQRYFAEIPATAALRSGWVVDRLALLAYPWTAVAASTLEATDRLVADESVPGGIRRSLTDAGDDLRRALAVRTRFAAPPTSRPPTSR